MRLGQNTSLIPRLSPASGESLGTRLALWLTSHNIVVLSCCGSMIVCVHVNVIIQLTTLQLDFQWSYPAGHERLIVAVHLVIDYCSSVLVALNNPVSRLKFRYSYM